MRLSDNPFRMACGAKTFDCGGTLGEYAVFASAGSKYGKGSFNKGIHLSMPCDIFFTNSSRSDVAAPYAPLTRDGGASVNRRYSLYALTERETWIATGMGPRKTTDTGQAY